MRNTRPNTFLTLCLLFALQLGIGAAALAKDVFPMQQGLHEWPAAGGKLILVVGTYQDTLSFRRSYGFYFKVKDQEEWNQVPLLRNGEGSDFAPVSASAGDVTMADGIVTSQGGNVYFIYADKRPAKGINDKGDTIVTWFKFVESDNDHPDDPGYYLKPVFMRTYAKSGKLKIEDILTKESTLKPAK
jgi:hypothetical protein